MMKEQKFWPLLLLLLLAVTPRNSSANVIASHDGMMDGAPPSFSGPTVNCMTGGAHANMSISERMKIGADILTATMTWLQDNRLSSDNGMTGGAPANCSGPTVNGMTGGAHANFSSPTVNGTTGGAHANFSGPTVNGMMGGAYANFSGPTVKGMTGGARANFSGPTVNGTTGGAYASFSGPTVNGMTSGAHANFSGPTVNVTTGGSLANMSSPYMIEREELITPANMSISEGMKEGADILTASMTWLQDNMLSSEFDESIHDLQIKISQLPSYLSKDRVNILDGLYRSQDRLIQLRSVLEVAATKLKAYCINLIDIYDDNESSERLLIYSAKKFVKYSKFVNGILEKALKHTKKIQDKMSTVKSLLVDFNSKLLEEEEKEIEKRINVTRVIKNLKKKLERKIEKINRMKREDEDYYHIANILSCVFTISLGCGIAIAITDSKLRTAITKANDDIEELQHHLNFLIKLKQDHLNTISKLLNDIQPAHESGTKLLSHVNEVKEYLTKEIDLIMKWQTSLEAAIEDHEDISAEDLEFNIKGIKERLNVLVKACDNYLDHELHGIFKSRES